MSKRGENITKRRDGRWEARVLKGYNQDGRAIYKSLYAPSYSEVKAKKIEYMALFNLKEIKKNSDSGVFDTILSLFLQYKKYQVKESTFACYTNIIDKHIRPALGIMKIQKIDSVVIESFIDEKLNSGRIDNSGGLSRKTVKDILTVLSLVLKYANKIGLMNISQIHYSLPKIEKEEIEIFSTDEEIMQKDRLIDQPLDKVVMHYAKNAADSGLDGVVCSPLEAALVKEKCGENFMTVTPGIRFADSAVGDQKRIMTPEKAGKSGCDYIVVGRPITQADDPVAAYRRAMKDFLGQ